MLPACLIDDPPPYTQPKRTPPRLVYHDAEPPLNQVITASRPDGIPFRIPVASEDDGEEVRAFLYLNGDSVGFSSVAASTIDDTSRVLLFNYRVRPENSGACRHRFTVRVGHESNLPNDSTPPRDTEDLAEAYWFAYLNPPADQNEAPTEDCPSVALGQP